MDMFQNDDILFGELAAVIKRRVPGFSIKYKEDSRWQRFLGFLSFFSTGYMVNVTTTLGETVWFPSRKFVKENRWRAFKILAHEYIHVLDGSKYSFLFQFLYALPQLFALFALWAILSFWFSNWWLLSLIALVFLAPLPAFGRAQLEFRAYVMNMAIALWRHGEILDAHRDYLVNVFSSWTYYRMWPFPNSVRAWFDDAEQRIRNIDRMGVSDSDIIFDDSEAYSDVYSLLTGIDFD
jgi:hypothetical protein